MKPFFSFFTLVLTAAGESPNSRDFERVGKGLTDKGIDVKGRKESSLCGAWTHGTLSQYIVVTE